MGDAAGAIVAAPLLLAWLRQPPPLNTPRRILEAAMLAGVTLLLCLFVFFRAMPFEYGLIPLLLWFAFHFGMRGVTSAAAVIAFFATIGTSHGASPFVRDTVNESLLYLHSFLGVSIVCALFVAGLLAERKRTEAALHESEERLCLLGDNLPDSYVYQYTYDADGTQRYLYLSAGVERLHGVKAEEVLRDSSLLHRHISPEQLPAFLAAKAVSFQALTDIEAELQVRGADGQWRWLLMRSHPCRKKDGQTLWNGVAADITARKQAEAARWESERKYRELVDNANSIIIHWGRDGRIKFMNEFGQRFFGYTEAEICGRNVIGTIVPETESSGRSLEKLMEEIRANPAAFEQNTNENMRRNGGRAWIAWTNKTALDQEGEVADILSIGLDITVRKNAEEELRAAQACLEQRVIERTSELAAAKDRAESADRVKSAFLATMSHELRTPLNSIIGFTGLLLRGLAGPLNTEQTKQLRMVKGSGQHLLDLINDVLDISKIEAGQIEIANAPFDLRESIEKIVQTVTPLADSKRLPLTVRIAPEVGGITCDRRRVEQIMLNLLSNAIKFTKQGQVTLAAEIVPGAPVSPASVLRVSVTDTGIGIKREDFEKLFQPFRQLDSGLTRQHEGTGLGLAICKRLVERLGGKIEVASEWGKGSTFVFLLPANPEGRS
jgi:PAS domain S-box-containing protein